MLVALKLGVGSGTGSLGLISAGIESSGDVVAAVLTLLRASPRRAPRRPRRTPTATGARRTWRRSARRPSSPAAAIVILVEAIGRLAGGGETLEPDWYVFAVIGVALRHRPLARDASRCAPRAGTAPRALRSNAFHFAGDMAGSLAVLVGFLAVDAGFEQGDTVAALVVACVIFAAAARLICENASVLMDRAPADARDRAPARDRRARRGHRAAPAAAARVGRALLRRRRVAVPPGQAVVEGHATADHVEQAVSEALPGSDVVVHVEPRRRGLDLRDRVLAAALAEPLVTEAHDITIFEHGGALQRLAAPQAPRRRSRWTRRTMRPSASRRRSGASAASWTCRRTWSRWSTRSP